MAISSLLSSEDGGIRGRRINGVVVGIVTDNDDPQKLGRVKVTFRWLSDDNGTDWARVANLYAGQDRGSLFTPEVEDEVLVAFEYGDINRPFVIGGLWNDEGKPPEPETDNSLKKIKTKSGHEIVLLDKDNKEKIEVKSKSGHKILLDDSSGSEKIKISDKTGNNLVLIDSVQNSIKITSNQKLNLQSSIIEISADSVLSLKSGGVLNIQGAIVKIN